MHDIGTEAPGEIWDMTLDILNGIELLSITNYLSMSPVRHY